ncbi:MAG TPA: hypothetical protein VMA13_05195, partial [Candidatus Saccharimonadales bacterium]|nr:hypothetical protein [Candidatus Saccharimonadales bacterium]
TAGTEPERNAAAKPQTEAPHVLCFQMSANGQAGCAAGRSEISVGQVAAHPVRRFGRIGFV